MPPGANLVRGRRSKRTRRAASMIIVYVTGSPDQILLDYACVIGAIAKPWSPQALENVLLLVRA